MTQARTTQPKVLVIYAHPEPNSSIVNQVLINRIQALDHVTVHDLYGNYPDFFIDVHIEQQKLLEHDVIVFQHPLYMYSCPALLKEWLDRVLSKGFAFGGGNAMQGKIWRSVISTGGREEAFGEEGYNKYPLEQILQPFELTAALCRMTWLDPLVLYWSRNVSDLEREQHAEQYCHWLQSLSPFGGQNAG
ncbi:glutathione-regulated potassium-efflux system ancillary protein KefG [Vibrio sp. AK197]|uniref:Glutathione-regulated potassium-efflux system ancillary protein KefG n=1 Tax=Vibrio olivae TaxID=1243002 RepID=A0ABV5HSI7_9VIBR